MLRGVDLRAAEQWLAQAGTDKERQPTALQTEYIIASRKAAAVRQRITLGAVSLGLVIAVILAVVALFARQEAVKQRDIAVTHRLPKCSATSMGKVISGTCVADQDKRRYLDDECFYGVALFISLMSTVASLPFLLFTLPAGALADKVDRQKLVCFINLSSFRLRKFPS